MFVISDNPQSRWKDSVAAAPSIDLCLLANGEEYTQVVTSKGNQVLAGIRPPEDAPSIADSGSGSLTASLYAGYCYVYAATTKYPSVQSNQAAGTSVAPRSNPSPNTVYQYTGGGDRKVRVTVAKTDRQDIDKIWIYRTALYTTEAAAQEAANANQAFYIGQVSNDGQVGTTFYTDDSLTLQQQVESDNLVAPTGQFAAYYDPYFFIFGQNELELEVDIAVNGIITITNSFDGVWLEGRNGQFIKFKDIDTGGFDSYGLFYFKWLTTTTAQLTLDQAGTQLASAPYFGTTKAKIYGYSTSLYRSKPNNPFAWGETVPIGTAIVAQSWVMKVGGGQGIAMTVIPNSSLLKLDLQNPARSYVFNLKQTQTDAFKSTRRLISDTYIPANNFCQFSGLDENKQLQIFGIDSRNFCITQTDGGAVSPISDPVKESIRNIIQQSTEHVHFHGFYDPNTELNCFFFREENGLPTVHKMIYNHAPSRQWGTLDCFDILCSAVVQDKFTGKTIILGGTASGFVGQLLKDYKQVNWIEDNPAFTVGAIQSVEDIQQAINILPPSVATEELDGRYFVLVGTLEGIAKYTVFWYHLNGSSSTQPSLLIGFTRSQDFAIRYLQIDYDIGDTNVELSRAIAIEIDAFNTCSSGPTRFPFEVVNYLGAAYVVVKWKLPVLYSVPLETYYDYNSGTEFNLVTEGGSSITYLASYHNNTEIDSEKVIGNWIILEKTSLCSISGIVWGRIKNIDLTLSENVFRVFLDLLYIPVLNGFIFELESFMQTETVTGYFALTDEESLLLLADGSSHLILGHITEPNGNAYIGITECLVEKHIDLTESTKNKNLNEVWISAENANQYAPYDTFRIGYLDQMQHNPEIYNVLNRDTSIDGTISKNNWFARSSLMVSPFKTFGFSLIQRGPTNFNMSNITLKMN